MRQTLALALAMILAGPAYAHPGHLVDAAGHDHWVAGAAIGTAILVGIWGALKGGRKSETEPEADAANDSETPEEASA